MTEELPMSPQKENAMRADLSECECVPGHRCDCTVLRQLLTDILTNAEYPKMEAEGLAAAGLGLVWSEPKDRYVREASRVTP